MAMVVVCESCRSRFRLSESLLKESKAVRFRCRKCGGSIMVRNPDALRDAPPVIPVPAVPAETAASPMAADIPPVVRPEVRQSVAHEEPVPSATVPRLEDLVLFSTGKEKAVVPPVVPPKASTRRKRSRGKMILVAGLSILLLAEGVLYFGTTEAGQELLGKWIHSRRSTPPVIAAAIPPYQLRDMSIVHEKAVAGNLVVVSGTVVNVGKRTSRGIQMRAALLGEANQVLMENSSLAGNLIDRPTLLQMNRKPIDVYLKMEHREEGGVHRDLPPGNSLPFMVVFFDPPEKIASFTVRAVDVD
jgi:predicted Zn finger-like uncharacterized protein